MTDTAEYRDAIDTPEEILAVREFFASHTPSECERIARLILQMGIGQAEINERAWRDFAPDGGRNTPGVMAVAAADSA